MTRQSTITMILQRIKKYLDYKGITIAAFERSTGMSNASFGKSLKNNGAIGTDKLENILTVYKDISPSWLLTGEGSMLQEQKEATASLIYESHTTIHERIKLLVNALTSGKNTVFAQTLGVSEANIRGYIKNVVPKADFLCKIVTCYSTVNPHWLLTGKGTMLQERSTDTSLKRENELLRQLLDEKERLIKVLMGQRQQGNK